MLASVHNLYDLTDVLLIRIRDAKNKIIGRGLVYPEQIPLEMMASAANVVAAKEVDAQAGDQPLATFSNLDSNSYFEEPTPEPEVKKPSSFAIMMPVQPGIH